MTAVIILILIIIFIFYLLDNTIIPIYIKMNELKEFYIEKFIKPDFEAIWLKVIIVIFSYLTSLMLFLLIKKVFIKNE